MLDERTKELINAGLDGELSESARRELDETLAQSEQARQAAADMDRLGQLLGELPDLDPPPGLSGQILDRVELPRRWSFREWLGLSPQATPAAYGLAFAAGLLMAVGFYELAPAPPAGGDMSGMVGTLTGNKQDAAVKPLHQLPVESGLIAGMVSLNAADDMLVLEFDLESDAAVGIDVKLEGTGLSFGGFAKTQSGIEALKISAGGLRFVNQGQHQFAVILREDGDTSAARRQRIEIDFNHEGDTVFGGELPLHR
jgi:hypothetical protein